MNEQPQMRTCLWNIKARTSFRPEVIVDVGACTGTNGLYGLFTEPDPLYLLVEPLEEFNATLRRHIGHRRHRIVNCSLSSFRGTAHFKVDPALKDSSHLVDLATAKAGAANTIETPVDTLDHLLEEHAPEVAGRQVDLLVKVDVQGAEPEVLKGGAAALARHNAVLIVEIGTARPSAIQVFSMLDALGYVLVDCIDFVRFKGTHRVTSQFDAVFARKSLQPRL